MLAIATLLTCVVGILAVKACCPTPHETALKLSKDFWELSAMAASEQANHFRTGMVRGAQKFDAEAHQGLKAAQVARLRSALAGNWKDKVKWRLSYWGL